LRDEVSRAKAAALTLARTATGTGIHG
jgi:hypothetical protein